MTAGRAAATVKALGRGMLPKWLLARLRLAKLDRLVKSYRAREVRHTYGGVELTIHLADPLAEGWYDHDWPELSEIALLKRHRLGPGAVVFDLGAHQCVVALVLADIVGRRGRVVAIEASPHNAAAGLRNRILNGAEQLIVVNAAAAAERGRLIVNRGLNAQVDDGSGAWGRRDVPALSIDDLTRTYGAPDVLFIDVEGFECQVLRGARDSLAQQPDCFVEVHAGVGLERLGGTADDVLGFFPPEAYDRFISREENGEFVPLARGAVLPSTRFFLVAIGRDQSGRRAPR